MPSQEEANVLAEVEPYDPKLVEEILKYNKKREEQIVNNKKEAERLRAREQAKYEQPKKAATFAPPNMFYD